MTLTTRPWRLTLVSIVAVALGATILAIGDDSDAISDWFSARIDARHRVQRTIASALQREGELAMREALYAASKHSRTQPGPQPAGLPSLRVISTDSVTDKHLMTLFRGVDHEFNSLRHGVEELTVPPRPQIQVILLADLPSSVPQRFVSATRDASVGRFVLVPRTINEPCTVFVVLRRADPTLLEQQLASGEGILGPCGFVAAFGLPGEGLRSALDSIGWRAAAFASWHAPLSSTDTLRPAWLDLSAPAVRCLTVADGACGEAWHALTTERSQENAGRALPPADAEVWDVTRLSWFPVSGASLGAREGALVSDLVRASDRATFGEAWRTSHSFEELVERSLGTSVNVWFAKWLARSYRAPVVGPLPNAREVAWTLMLGVLSALVIAKAGRVRRRSPARA